VSRRDTQRSRVYAWERAVTAGACYSQTIKSVEEVAAFLKPIWLAERGRYGRANVPLPEIHHGHWGQRRALAYNYHRISLPKWARNPWVILHEAAHLLDRKNFDHGPRFVGILIGLAARHLGHDADDLMEKADEMGVRYDVRSIGAVPVIPMWKKVEPLMPGTAIEIAVELGVSYRVVLGAALQLIRAGRARWRRQVLTPVTGLLG
jgi:hypothetical protein